MVATDICEVKIMENVYPVLKASLYKSTMLHCGFQSWPSICHHFLEEFFNLLIANIELIKMTFPCWFFSSHLFMFQTQYFYKFDKLKDKKWPIYPELSGVFEVLNRWYQQDNLWLDINIDCNQIGITFCSCRFIKSKSG